MTNAGNSTVTPLWRDLLIGAAGGLVGAASSIVVGWLGHMDLQDTLDTQSAALTQTLESQKKTVGTTLRSEAEQAKNDLLRTQRRAAYADLMRVDQRTQSLEISWVVARRERAGPEVINSVRAQAKQSFQLLQETAPPALLVSDCSGAAIENLITTHRDLFARPEGTTAEDITKELGSRLKDVAAAGETFQESARKDVRATVEKCSP